MRQSSIEAGERAARLLKELERLGDYNETVGYVRELAQIAALLAEGQVLRRRGKRTLAGADAP